MDDPATLVPAAPLRRSLLKIPLRVLIRIRRRPRRALALFGLIVVFVAASLYTWREVAFRSHLRTARTELARGHNSTAIAALRVCQAIHPNDDETLLLTADLARRAGSWEEAEEILDRYWQIHGDDDRLIFERLLLRATRGELETSAPLLIARIEANGPDARAAREALVTGLLYRFRRVEAERNLQAWLAANPDDTAALLLRGRMQEQQLQTGEALLTYRNIVELDPEHDEARLRMTTILLQLRQTEELVDNLSYLKNRLPNHPVVLVQWVKALSLQGRTDEARAALEDCLKKFPDFGPALAERGALAIQDGDDKAVEEYLGRATRLDPGDSMVRNQYAQALARNGKPDEAAREQEALNQLRADQERLKQLIDGPLQSRPNDPAPPHEIGVIALRSGQPAEALRWLQAAIQIDPDYLPSHQVLSGFYQNSGNPALAAKHRAIARRLAGAKQP
jgi:tetratricopeptide (TPR) repeat protein